MFKRFGYNLIILLSLGLFGCKPNLKLNSIRLSGTNDVLNIPMGSYFNVLQGVIATGDNQKDYTKYVTFETDATVSLTGILDTTETKTVILLYKVQVGKIEASKWRYLGVTE